jgi:hypothetical protein
MPESEPARPPWRLLSCALAGSVEPKGVESNRGLERDGRAAANIESAAAQVCKIIERVCSRERSREAASARLNRCKQKVFCTIFWSKMYSILVFLAEKTYIRGFLDCARATVQVARGPNLPPVWTCVLIFFA